MCYSLIQSSCKMGFFYKTTLIIFFTKQPLSASRKEFSIIWKGTPLFYGQKIVVAVVACTHEMFNLRGNILAKAHLACINVILCELANLWLLRPQAVCKCYTFIHVTEFQSCLQWSSWFGCQPDGRATFLSHIYLQQFLLVKYQVMTLLNKTHCIAQIISYIRKTMFVCSCFFLLENNVFSKVRISYFFWHISFTFFMKLTKLIWKKISFSYTDVLF